MSKPDPLLTIKKLHAERYPAAQVIFWTGSVSHNHGTAISDLDLLIVVEHLEHAYHEAFVFDGWPIDAFIHDLETLCYFFNKSRQKTGIIGMAKMILEGKEVTTPSKFSQHLIDLAIKMSESGPAKWEQNKIDAERFVLTDILDDIKCPASKAEQLASAAHLFECLLQFYFRAQNKWSARGKTLLRYLQHNDPELATEYITAFEALWCTGDLSLVIKLVEKILSPYGGLLWDGFRAEAPAADKMSELDFLQSFS